MSIACSISPLIIWYTEDMSEKYSEIEFSKELASYETPIDGMVVYDLPVHGDERGWFKENWQKEKMTNLGLPDFGPVQNNVSFNAEKGVTRGLHAEPWDKYVSTGAGSVYGAWCDIRENSPTYGQTFSVVLDPAKAIFVPRGVANGFQALEDNTVYMYLVNDHWSPDAQYSNVSIFDESLDLQWPIPLSDATISEKDHNHPVLAEATPIPPKKTLITGANGQLGRALQELYPNAECVDRDSMDISDPSVLTARRWKDYGLILNAAAYTAVDKAETPEGRIDAWKANAAAPQLLARIALENQITLVHVSSEYVFDGTQTPHTEDEPFSPLGVYGQSKAAGDIAVATAPRHYTVRTSWVIGDGHNFVKTMQSLAERDIKPTVVDDQIGRPTFTSDLARGIKHLIDTKADYGTYNLSSTGEPASWCGVAKKVYELSGKPSENVSPVSTEEYYANAKTTAKQKAEAAGEVYEEPLISPRPLQSTLNIDKITNAGFTPRNWEDALREYIDNSNKEK